MARRMRSAEEQTTVDAAKQSRVWIHHHPTFGYWVRAGFGIGIGLLLWGLVLWVLIVVVFGGLVAAV